MRFVSLVIHRDHSVSIVLGGLLHAPGQISLTPEPDEKLAAGEAVTRKCGCRSPRFFKPLPFGVSTASVIGQLGQGVFAQARRTG